ncbi:Ig-like domain-containing protein [Micromonospora sp. NBC_01813]|uniref:Ig-like domain-containing protein n=1 Tax=Micromonospora sp. NBC_01813 TaxID=2975988 RepID=UPI002DDAD3BF|nr:Ig-like domain-containing protein [Micromonospora sp. NBC_01813]WSA11398.1 Ig-like domain-containing protein [Micromonospora sp. NBC_01813]
MRRIIASLVAVVLTVTGGVLALVLRPAFAAATCLVDYQIVREWSDGFVADVELTNLGAPVSIWTLRFSITGQHTIQNIHLQAPPGVRLSALTGPVNITSDGGYELGTGESVRVRFGGWYAEQNPVPTSFFFNDQHCNGDLPPSPTGPPPSPSIPPVDPTPPVVSVLSPQPNQIFAAPGEIPIRAAATAAAGREIIRVEFRSRDTLLHVDTTAPYEFLWSGAPPANGTRIAATAYDDTGSRTTAEVRGIRIVTPAPPGQAPVLTVSGNQIVTVDHPSVPYQLRGVVRSGAETLCRAGEGVFDGPVDDASIRAMRRWQVNAVRILLDQDCWLDRDTVPPAYRGAVYRDAVTDYARRLIAHGVTPVLARHGPMTTPHGNFWTAVGVHFADDNAILFDLHSDSYPPVGNLDPDTAWSAWRFGASGDLPGWPAIGVESIVYNTRIFAGAHNAMLVGGLDGGNDLSGWLAHRPVDSKARNLAAAWHVDDDAACATPACWEQQVAPVAAEVPVVAVEVSEDTGRHRFVGAAIDWLDHRELGFFGSVWHPEGYEDVPALIRDYHGRPTPYGAGVKARLRH